MYGQQQCRRHLAIRQVPLHLWASPLMVAGQRLRPVLRNKGLVLGAVLPAVALVRFPALFFAVLRGGLSTGPSSLPPAPTPGPPIPAPKVKPREMQIACWKNERRFQTQSTVNNQVIPISNLCSVSVHISCF